MVVDLLKDAVEMGHEACVTELMSAWYAIDWETRESTLYRLRTSMRSRVDGDKRIARSKQWPRLASPVE
jgi:hypothetical protein